MDSELNLIELSMSVTVVNRDNVVVGTDYDVSVNVRVGDSVLWSAIIPVTVEEEMQEEPAAEDAVFMGVRNIEQFFLARKKLRDN